MRRILIVVVVVVVILAAAAALGSRGSSGPTASESATAAVLAGNVKDSYSTDDWYQTLQQVNGLPNIEVIATTAFVFTNIANTDVGKTSAATICHDVAAVTNDPNTAAPLGLTNVEVDGGSGNDQLATCDVP